MTKHKGYVYKLWSPQTDKVYIGSTASRYLSQRMSAHTSSYRKGKGCVSTAHQILEYPDATIELLETVLFQDKHELYAREGHWIREIPNCVNKNQPGLPPGVSARNASHRYYQKNKEAVCARVRNLYHAKKANNLNVCN